MVPDMKAEVKAAIEHVSVTCAAHGWRLTAFSAAPPFPRAARTPPPPRPRHPRGPTTARLRPHRRSSAWTIYIGELRKGLLPRPSRRACRSPCRMMARSRRTAPGRWTIGTPSRRRFLYSPQGIAGVSSRGSVRRRFTLAIPLRQKADPGASGADHLSQHLLRNIGDHSFGLAFLAKMSEQQKDPSQPLFAGIEELIHQTMSKCRSQKLECRSDKSECRSDKSECRSKTFA